MKTGKTSRILQMINVFKYKALHELLNVSYKQANPREAAGTACSLKNGTSAVPVTMGAGDTFWTA
jgi:hypothetical protein